MRGKDAGAARHASSHGVRGWRLDDSVVKVGETLFPLMTGCFDCRRRRSREVIFNNVT